MNVMQNCVGLRDFEGEYFFFKQMTAYDRRISDWSSAVCSSVLLGLAAGDGRLGVVGDAGRALCAAGQGIAGHRVGTGADVDVVVAGRGRAGDGGHRLVESARERRETLREGVAGDGVVAGAEIGRAHV